MGRILLLPVRGRSPPLAKSPSPPIVWVFFTRDAVGDAVQCCSTGKGSGTGVDWTRSVGRGGSVGVGGGAAEGVGEGGGGDGGEGGGRERGTRR